MSKWIIKTARGKLDVMVAWVVWARFARYARPHRVALLLALVGALGAVAAQVIAPWPIKIIFDHILSDNMASSWLAGMVTWLAPDKAAVLRLVCGVIVLVAILDATFSHLRDVTLAQVGQRVVGNIRRDLFAHLQTLPPAVFERRRTGDLLMRLTGDIQMLRQMLVNAVVRLGQSGLTVVAMIIAMFWLNPVLAMLGVMTIPITLWSGWRISRQIRTATKSQREKESAVASIAHDVLGAMAIVQAFNREPIEQKRFSRQNRSSMRAGVKTTRLQSKLYRIVSVASSAAMCCILYVGVRFVLDESMTAGDLLVFIAYLRGLNKPMRNMSKLAGQVAKATTCGERVAEIFALKPAVRDRERAHRLEDVRGRITFENVSFSYDEHVQAITNVSLSVEPGQRVALVGHTGAGKSTLAKLLLRFYDPQDGCVRIDDNDIRDVKLETLRGGIGWVHQDTILFGMTIAENIALGCSDASGKRIRSVARQVGAHEFIKALPDGYDTVLGQGGCSLSGGQRQCLALARAILPGPPILLLDEPATGLDAISREHVERSWMSPDNTATTIVICHRLRDMHRFDKILVLRNGEVCERGTHAELMALGGEYAAMVEAGDGPDPKHTSPERLAC